MFINNVFFLIYYIYEYSNVFYKLFYFVKNYIGSIKINFCLSDYIYYFKNIYKTLTATLLTLLVIYLSMNITESLIYIL